jgi:Terminase small subunit
MSMDTTSAAAVPFAQLDTIDMIIAGIHPGLISLSPENNNIPTWAGPCCCTSCRARFGDEVGLILLAKKLNPAWTSKAPARSALYGGVLGQDGGSKPSACSTTDAASIVVRDAFGDCNGLRSSPGAPLLVMSATESTKPIRTEITADRVLQGLAAIAFADPRKLFSPDGRLKPLDEIDDDTRAALVIEATQGTDADGNPTFTRKVKFAEKLRALEMLGKHLGLFRDRLEIAGSAENPIQILIQKIQGSSIRPVIEGVVEEYDRAA